MTTTEPTDPEDLAALSTPDLEAQVRMHGRLRQEAETAAATHQEFVERAVLELLKRDPNRLRAELSELAGRGDETWIKRLAAAAGIPTPTRKAGSKERTTRRILDLLESDPEMPVVEAAAQLKLSPERVRLAMREHNLPPRPRKGRSDWET
ncbi:winged helix-turn-helix transcriptional regulator [Nocardiopsis synnemataformans]|uniref:winged helix-turn-helix transcriptional regulator n=1 Tax=Nocardiopsis synnemataformans TaxID=61305 RepID=UPI003EBE47F9